MLKYRQDDYQNAFNILQNKELAKTIAIEMLKARTDTARHSFEVGWNKRGLFFDPSKEWKETEKDNYVLTLSS